MVRTSDVVMVKYSHAMILIYIYIYIVHTLLHGYTEYTSFGSSGGRVESKRLNGVSRNMYSSDRAASVYRTVNKLLYVHIHICIIYIFYL